MSDDFADRLRAVLDRRSPQRVTVAGARDAAVLIPMVGGPEPAVIFTVRTESVPSHKGQIAFPGGSADPGDDSPATTALRETEEEIGLPRSGVEVLGQLDSFPTFVSGFVVTPVIGILRRVPDLTPNPAEVAEVLHVPLAALSEDIRAEAGFRHDGRTYPTEAWIWDDYVIWGVTARIVRGFLEVCAEAGIADPPAATASWSWMPNP